MEREGICNPSNKMASPPSEYKTLICIAFTQCWTNGADVGPTLYKYYIKIVLCLLGRGKKLGRKNIWLKTVIYNI